MKRCLIAWLLSTIGLFASSAQAKSRVIPSDSIAVESLILSFLREVYQTQHDALKIAHQYVELDNSPGATPQYSDDKRYQVAANITLLREGKGVSSFASPLTQEQIATLRIVPYTKLAATAGSKLLDFGLDAQRSKHLYVVLSGKAVWKYFYVDKNRIYAFDYLRKGKDGPAYLFSY